MANLSVKEIINRGCITDVSVASALLSGDLTLDEAIVKGSITKVADYQDIFVDADPNSKSDAEIKAEEDDAAVYEDDENPDNNVTFKVDGDPKEFAGEPTTVSAKRALKELGIAEPLYVDGVVFDTKGKKAIDLQDLTFTTELPVVEEGGDNTLTDGGETTGEPEGDTTVE